MGGGLLQLVAYGAQDVYLTGNPQITFFKVVYRRHTNFALESIQQTFNGSVGYGQRVTATISRNGDLISRAYLELETSDLNLVPYFGLRVLKEAEVEIGGQKIDKHYSAWMYIWNELTMPEGKKEAYFNMVGGGGSLVGGNKLALKMATTPGDAESFNFGDQQTTFNVTVKTKNSNGEPLPGRTILKIEGKANGTSEITVVSSIGYNDTSFGVGVEYYIEKTEVVAGLAGATVIYYPGDWVDGNADHFVFKGTDTSTTPSTQSGNTLDLTSYFEQELNGNVAVKNDNIKLEKMYVPLQFWFCNNFGLALPLIGLQYHEVKINVQFEEAQKCILNDIQTIPSDLKASLWVDYVYLDTDERRKFAQSSHEYLIEQLQFTGSESASNKVKLNFNHPVKELIWIVDKEEKSNENWFNFTNDKNKIGGYYSRNNAKYEDVTDSLSATRGSINPVKSAKLILNGNDRFYERDGRYFNLVQPFQHHTNVPNNAGINVYSFALKPEEHQPSGSLNMSRIDTATLSLNYETASSSDNLSVYAVNYNVLRILSGMGGIAYSN
tara:strand:+ start:9303 stop:10958 length:1656 start_codon:yes stop_codon:yes gene_type:complete